MPSYIELDKNGTFPSSSNVGKVIFGINTSGQPTVINSTGLNIPISSSYAATASYALNGGGGGNTPIVPTAADYRVIQSYNHWAYGVANKFTVIDSNTFPADYLVFQFEGGTINGQNIPKSQTSQSIYVNHTNITYRDDGYGLVATNYTDFINEIFASHSLYTRVTGSMVSTPNGNPGPNFIYNFATTDNFTLVFKETGVIGGNINNLAVPLCYSIGTVGGISITDSFNVSAAYAYIDLYNIYSTKLGYDITP